MGRRDLIDSKMSQVMRAGSYPIRLTPALLSAASTSTVSGPLAIRILQVDSCAAWIWYRGSVNRMLRSGKISRAPLLPVKPVR